LARNTRLELEDTLLYTRDPIEEGDYTVRRNREAYYRNVAVGRIIQQFGQEDSFNLGYRYNTLENDDPTYEDTKQYNPFGGLTYWFTNRFGFDASGSYEKVDYVFTESVIDPSDDFERWRGSAGLINRFNRQTRAVLRYTHTDVNYDDEGLDYRVYNPSVNIIYEAQEDLTLDFEIGYFWEEQKQLNQSSRENEDGVTLRAILDKAYRTGSFNLYGNGGYDIVAVGAENLGNTLFYEFGGSITHSFSRFVTGDIRALYREADYIDNIDGRKDKIGRAGAGLSFRILEWMSLRFGYTFNTVNSNIEVYDYEENRISAMLTLAPAQPFRLGD
jgi:hypothetical protein